jgi:hypothetical protein
MEPKDEWVFFKEIDWDCPKNNRFNVDTRDFHCGYFWGDEHNDINKLKDKPEFFLTKEELIELLERYYIESGGEGEWRFFELDSREEKLKNWALKYIRIFRTELGFIVCNSDERAIRKDILDSPVLSDNLNHIKK